MPMRCNRHLAVTMTLTQPQHGRSGVNGAFIGRQRRCTVLPATAPHWARDLHTHSLWRGRREHCLQLLLCLESEWPITRKTQLFGILICFRVLRNSRSKVTGENLGRYIRQYRTVRVATVCTGYEVISDILIIVQRQEEEEEGEEEGEEEEVICTCNSPFRNSIHKLQPRPIN